MKDRKEDPDLTQKSVRYACMCEQRGDKLTALRHSQIIHVLFSDAKKRQNADKMRTKRHQYQKRSTCKNVFFGN